MAVWTNGNTWNTWVASTTTTTTGTTGTLNVNQGVWATWTSTSASTLTSSYQQPPETEERRAERIERARQRAERAKAREEQRKIAGERARDLLRLILTDDQWHSFEESQSFHVIGSAGGRYRVRFGTAGNVDLVEGESVIESLCAHPPLWEGEERLPAEDVIAAQVLALRHDEPGFRAVANITRRNVARAA